MVCPNSRDDNYVSSKKCCKPDDIITQLYLKHFITLAQSNIILIIHASSHYKPH